MGGISPFGMQGGKKMGNLKYSPMSHGTTDDATIAMPVSGPDALKAAHDYLDASLSGAETTADADAFYGYYTIDILRDGSE